MANILVRSPRYETYTMGGSQNSIKLELYIDSVLRYTIVKNAASGTKVTFEISELIRDYITQAFTGGQTQPITVSTASSNVKQYTGENATGTEGSPTAITHTAFDGYGTFMEGINPTLAANSIWLISKDVIKDGYYIYAPENTAGWVSQITAGGTPTQVQFSGDPSVASYTSITVGSTVLNIVRIDCTKYGDGHKITFVNKFGAMQDLWFSLKSVKTTESTKETYNANTIDISSGSATYSVNTPTKNVFNKTATQRIVLSSGYYPEGANPFFEELLLSNNIWLTQPDPFNPSVEQVVPVIVKSSTFTYKTSLNDRLIDYVMEFEMAFSYINSVR
tara:strand:+ start:1598 stop:2599 length:1002 start_codon:yes stop_codon:yes gene_type:complete